MPYATTNYAVLIASPSDLSEERQAAKQAIHDWNDLNAKAEGIALHPQMWETHATPAFGDRPQAIINEQLVNDADLLIGLFWTKVGTSTGIAISGTAEEIDQIVAAGKPAMLYISKRPIDPSDLDLEQLKGLKAFKDAIDQRALIGSFTSPDDLKAILIRDLTRQVRMTKERHAAKAVNVQLGVQNEQPPRERLDAAQAARKRFEDDAAAGKFRKMMGTTMLTLSIVPLKSLQNPLRLHEVESLFRVQLRPMDSGGYNHEPLGRSHFTVRCLPRLEGHDTGPLAVAELTEDGIVYAVRDIPKVPDEKDPRPIHFGYEEQFLIVRLRGYLQMLRSLGVTGDLLIGIALLGVQNCQFIPPQEIKYWRSRRTRVWTQDRVTAKDLVIKGNADIGTDQAVACLLRDRLNEIWREAGLDYDPYFTPEGEYVGPQTL